ncbi:MAG: hypothetical protein GTO18_12340 [Anaerolineales bacterium]|nr:hypothetical protein [Anaerolineales bacterium]
MSGLIVGFFVGIFSGIGFAMLHMALAQRRSRERSDAWIDEAFLKAIKAADQAKMEA